MSISDKVLGAIREETDEDCSADTPLSMLNLDSLEFMTLLMRILEQTGVEIPYESLPELETVADLIAEAEKRA